MSSIPSFIPGLELSEWFYHEAVKPLLAKYFPGLPYSAARLDMGSDVLGFDTPQSMDHGWGPRLNLFLAEEEFERVSPALLRVLRDHLPYEVAGFPTHFSDPRVHLGGMERITEGPITHGVSVWTTQAFFSDYLLFDPEEISAVQWLIAPEQRLRTVASGKVFHDGLGMLVPIREKLRYYPRDLWFYLMAAQWQRISQEEPFMARCGDVGDDLGSRLLAARRIHDLMRLGFMIERTYAPYSKWFGTAFSRLDCASQLTPIFDRVWRAANWKERETCLSDAYVAVAHLHNGLGITPPLSTELSTFFGRPYQVIQSGRFVDALRDAIESEEVRQLPPHLGSVNQLTDSTDILDVPAYLNRLKGVYGPSSNL